MGVSSPRATRSLALWFRFLAHARAKADSLSAPHLGTPPEATGEALPAPLVLVERRGQALRLAAVGPDAPAYGLSAGMTLADARARVPGLLTAPHDPAADAAVLDRLLMAMSALTPVVMPDPPDGLLLDITGCAHLFGGEAVMAARAADLAARVLPDLGLVHAFGGNPLLARALARHGDPATRAAEDMAALPITALDPPADTLTALHRAGLRHLGDLIRRPARTLAARFGDHLVLRLRQLAGDVGAPLDPHRPEAPLRADMRFAEPIARESDVLDAVGELLHQLNAELERRALGGRRFVLGLWRSDGARRQLVVETGQPQRDHAAVLRLFAERLDNLADPLDPGFGFDMVRLAVTRCDSLPPAQIALDGASAVHDSLAALVDRLAVRLGAERILRPQAHDCHRPEAADTLVPATSKPLALPPPENPRPLLLFDPPQPVEVIASVPDGPPLRLRWRGQIHEIAAAEGPERIASEWWRRRGGHWGHDQALRDYYRVEDSHGRRLWVFRRGAYGAGPAPGWFVHGLFA